jgi:hypothetical protein
MRKALTILFVLMACTKLQAQQASVVEGSVSYVTSQNVYVRFLSTEGIKEGDTLLFAKEGVQVPALVVLKLSSISAVCKPMEGIALKTGDLILGRSVVPEEIEDQEPATPALGPALTISPEEAEQREKPLRRKDYKQQISGKAGITSYSAFDNQEDGITQRMRYTAAINADHISNSPLSAEAYIAFSHRDEQWELIRANVYEGLKIYSLAARYDLSENTRLILGRKINPRISSMGAIDGLQFEHRFGSFSAGVLAGSRPDLQDYSFNIDLFQAGAYISHDKALKKGLMQSSLAIVEQRNGGNTDRRFTYLQHSNQLLKQLYFFGSGEFDLYTLKEGKAESTLRLTNAFLSLRYEPIRKLRLTASYSARNNIIYYETYKSFIDKLLELETIQGYRLGATYRPFNNLMIGAQAGYRSRPEDLKASRNLYAHITRTNIPWIALNATVSATLLSTSYIEGAVYGIAFSRDIIPGKLSGSAGYRYTDYNLYGEIPVLQHVGDLSIHWQIMKDLAFSLSEEATFESDVRYHRLFLSLRKRFR